MTQYVVVYLPTMDLNPEAVGPFRSYKRAIEARDAIDEAAESQEGDTASPASVVPLVSLGYALAHLRGDA